MQRAGMKWLLVVRDVETGKERRVQACALVNAVGPWVSEKLESRIGGDLAERQIRWMMTREIACNAEDIVWHRTRQGLRMTLSETASIDAIMAASDKRVEHVGK